MRGGRDFDACAGIEVPTKEAESAHDRFERHGPSGTTRMMDGVHPPSYLISTSLKTLRSAVEARRRLNNLEDVADGGQTPPQGTQPAWVPDMKKEILRIPLHTSSASSVLIETRRMSSSFKHRIKISFEVNFCGSKVAFAVSHA